MGRFRPGILMVPPEGDAGTGMVATIQYVLAWQCISRDIDICYSRPERRLERLHPEIDTSLPLQGSCDVSTPISLQTSTHRVFSASLHRLQVWQWIWIMYSTLSTAALTDSPSDRSSPQFPSGISADADAGGLSTTVSIPLPARHRAAGICPRPHSRMTLGNFYAGAAVLYLVRENRMMVKDEHVAIDTLVGHGGIFTPVVAQRILASLAFLSQ